MKCSRCQHENRPGAKYCEQCGATLKGRCSKCGGALPETAKFCPECGHPVPASEGTRAHPVSPDPVVDSVSLAARGTAGQVLPEGDRRHATVLLADISGYTSLCASMDAEQVQSLLGRFYEATDGIIASYGGHVLDHAGDATAAVFGAPRAHDNDPERAVRAALEMHAAAGRVVDPAGRPLRLHIGIASGEVVAGVRAGGAKPGYAVTGATANLAARLDALAQSGETLVSEALYRSVMRVVDAESMGAFALKGFDGPVQVWRVRGARASGAEHRPFVGRKTELRQLTAVIEAVQESGVGAAVFIRGEAGIGKSRLVQEIRGRAQDRGFACHMGHVLDFGVGKGQDAIPMILKELLQVEAPPDEAACRAAVDRALKAGLVEADEEVFLTDLLDVEQPERLKTIFDAMDSATRSHRVGEVAAALVKRAATRDPRLLIVEDVHWGSPALLRHLALLTISAAQCPMVLVMTSRFDGDPLDKSWRASTHGTPLMTVDLGPLRPEEARLMAGDLIEVSNRVALTCIERAEGNPLFLDQLLRGARESESAAIPGSIQSLVLMRMDRLGARDKQALQAASIIGKRFTQDALRFLTEDSEYRCEALVAADLVRPEGEDFLFAHALIQEGVYASLLNSRKRGLHRRAADWFGDREPGLRAEHLDRAGDPGAAQAYLIAATAQAQRTHYDVALQLTDRGVDLTAAGPTRCALTLLRGDLLREFGRSEDSIAAFRAGLDSAEDEMQRCRAWIGIAAGNRVTGEFAAAMNALREAETMAKQHGLAIESSRIHHMRGNLLFARGEVSACGDEHKAALAFAEQIADAECEANALSGLGDAHYAQGRMLTALEYFRRCVNLSQQAGFVRVEIPNRCMVGHCLWYNNELSRAVAEANDASEAARRVGLVQSEIFAQECLSLFLIEAGCYDEAEQAGIRCLSRARPAGARRYESAALYVLARVQLARDNRKAARDDLARSLELARQTGMGFLGAAIYGRMACAAEDPRRRKHALHEGEMLLREACVGHCHLWFYRDAIEATLSAGDWNEALRYASALENYVRPEPLPWAELIVWSARALAGAGIHGLDSDRLLELRRLRDDVQKAGLGSALPALEMALTRA